MVYDEDDEADDGVDDDGDENDEYDDDAGAAGSPAHTRPTPRVVLARIGNVISSSSNVACLPLHTLFGHGDPNSSVPSKKNGQLVKFVQKLSGLAWGPTTQSPTH